MAEHLGTATQTAALYEDEMISQVSPRVLLQAGDDAERAAQIAGVNDAFRAAITDGGNPAYPGKYVATRGVADRGTLFVMQVQAAVAAFAEFTEDNDPYGDHTFGAVTVGGKVVWWKIDLYDADYLYGSDDPLDAEKTRRVLTLLFPHEY